ncbi:hypothetical protein IGG59_004602 [Escherichia coli]|nr:hypothetical protein [Escherichia coli O11:H15]EGI4366746.1 hypothetical protein [Escherichia coli]EHR8422869.1 hypothetical protein [Escherichia coli]EIE4704857.1 hypothetical protein [Escherichia coli]EII3575102.1 hypothetical protein [Escherichia coli]
MSRFVLGNCIDVMARIPDNAIDFILTDPPYLVGFRDRQGRLFSWAVTTSYRVAETGDTGAGGGGRLSVRAKTPSRLAPAGREAGHAGASPVTLPVCDVSDSGVFLSSYVMELFLMLLFLYLLL